MEKINNGIMNLSKIKKLIGNSSIHIPDLQRDYVWGKLEWRRLWDDIISIWSRMSDEGSEDKFPQHYVGTLTLQDKGDGAFDLLDGQQRFTTISVLIDYLNYCLNIVDDEILKNSRVSRVDIDYDNFEKNKDKYIEIYRFFMDCHYEINYQHASELLDIVNNRLFFLVHVADSTEDAHEIFEGINATGKKLELSDLLLNSLMEKDKDNESEIKEKWNYFIGFICGKTVITFTNEDEEEITEEIINTSPLKLKKFFNALNSMTLGENIPFHESVSNFNCMVDRLGDFGVFSNLVDSSINTIGTLIRWAEIYSIVVNPIENYGKIIEKKYAREVYYLSIWNATMYIPTIMRILYRNLVLEEDQKGMYSDDVVESMLKTILSLIANTRIILNRVHADDRNLEKKVQWIDMIYDAIRHNNSNDDKNIISAIVGEKTVLMDKAEDMIKAYQYTSAGSKFLLALYVDANNPGTDASKSKVFELEINEGKAQVEHMVAQNLEGDFSNYGFSVSTIGLLDNLILLSGSVNQKISSNIPEDKLEAWKKDPFGCLFEKYIQVPDDCSKFKESQEKKVSDIVSAFKKYFNTPSIDRKKKLNLTFAKKIYKNGKYEKLCLESASELLQGNSDIHYLRIHKDKYEENPNSNDNNTQGCYFCVNDNVEELKELSTNNIISKFCELIGKEELYEWLKTCEGTIDRDNVKNGSNKVKYNNKEFVYSQKMIHTCDLEKDELFKNVLTREKKAPLKLMLKNNEAICISNDFNIRDCIPCLKEIYNNFNMQTEFGFWVKVVKKQPVWVDNILIQTEYINIGNTDIYEKFLKTEYNNIFSTKEDAKKLVPNTIDKNGQEVCCYFKYEQMNFECISKLENVQIPEYQRAYVWDRSNWSTLLEQIKSHDTLFLGTIVLRKENNSLYIVDGQQRLTTLTGFYIGQNENTECSEVLKEKSKNNGVIEFIKSNTDKIDFSKLLFDVIIISDEADRIYQYEVFSSINSAGKKLTEEEKIANYLFSKYGGEVEKPETIREIAHNPGFAKAFCECMVMDNCKSENIYLSFKRIVEEKKMDFEQLYTFSNIFFYIKGNENINVFDNEEYPIWLELINMLEVTTADALMLNWASRILSSDSEEKYVDFEKLTKKICILYFLLYVMDRSGNAKKSANLNFIKCMKNDAPLAKKVVNSQADLPYWNEQNRNKVADNIWNNYVLSLPIYDIGQANIKRFILLMIEYLLVDESKFKIDDWKNNVRNQKNLDIEHIFPASEKNWPKDLNLIPISRLNYLENVMLLETKINKSVKDKMLREKINAGYNKSSLFMVKMLCDIAKESEVYNSNLATNRLKEILKIGSKNFESLIADVMVTIDCKMTDNNIINIKPTVNKAKAYKKGNAISKTSDIGIQNLKLVIQYTIANANQTKPKDLEKFSECRKSAINSVVQQSGKGSKYKSTVSDQVTRRIGLSMNEFDEALFAKWKGTENKNYVIIRKKIGE